MARRAFEVIDVVELLQHWHAGRSKAEVAASVGINRGTVRNYVAAAEAAGLVPGGRPLSRGERVEDEWVELVRGWFPTLIDAKARSITYPTINAYRDRIETMLATNTVTTVHQRLRDEHGLVTGISSFRRYVWLEFPDAVSPVLLDRMVFALLGGIKNAVGVGAGKRVFEAHPTAVQFRRHRSGLIDVVAVRRGHRAQLGGELGPLLTETAERRRQLWSVRAGEFLGSLGGPLPAVLEGLNQICHDCFIGRHCSCLCHSQ